MVVADGDEPQATAVELAQLGEGCRGQADPCREWIISSNKNLREAKKLLFAILKNRKNSCKLQSKKDS